MMSSQGKEERNAVQGSPPKTPPILSEVYSRNP